MLSYKSQRSKCKVCVAMNWRADTYLGINESAGGIQAARR
jgi:hypothetical protein